MMRLMRGEATRFGIVPRTHEPKHLHFMHSRSLMVSLALKFLNVMISMLISRIRTLRQE